MKKYSLLFLIILYYNCLSSQIIHETYSSDTIKIEKEIIFDTDILIPDTFYNIKSFENENEHWKVFYSINKDNLLLEKYCINDSCYTFQYFFNGNLKRKQVTIEGFNLVYEEIWCENGQLIRKVDYTIMPQHITNYYCNGKKKNEFTLNEYRAIGIHLWWYDNGQIKTEGFFNNEGNQSGIWKYYDDHGKLLKEEKYDDGKLKDTKDY